MWKQELEKLVGEVEQYSGNINQGMDMDSKDKLTKLFKEKFQVSAPKKYIDILFLINGLDYNGVVLYGFSEQDTNVYDLFCNNDIWHDNSNLQKYIFFGEGNISWFVYDVEENRYCVLDKPSGIVCNTFDSFDGLIDNLLQEALE